MPRSKRKNLCALCGGELVERPVRVMWEKPDGTPACVEGVPAKVCQRCGHRWFGAQAARQLEAAFTGEREPAGIIAMPVYSFE